MSFNFYSFDAGITKQCEIEIENDIKIQSKLTDIHNESLKKLYKTFTVKQKHLYTPDNTNIIKKLGYYILVKK